MRCFASEQLNQWAKWISWAEYWYNTEFQGAVGKTTFECVYERTPPTLVQFLSGEFVVAVVADEFWNRDEVIRQLKYNLDRARKRMATQANK